VYIFSRSAIILTTVQKAINKMLILPWKCHLYVSLNLQLIFQTKRIINTLICQLASLRKWFFLKKLFRKLHLNTENSTITNMIFLIWFVHNTRNMDALYDLLRIYGWKVTFNLISKKVLSSDICKTCFYSVNFNYGIELIAYHNFNWYMLQLAF
jgi:hypothetical protein